jgi:hypothetical protein
MTDSQTVESDEGAPRVSGDTRTFSLSCGCFSVTSGGRLVAIEWCPRHSAMHGKMMLSLEPSQGGPPE